MGRNPVPSGEIALGEQGIFLTRLPQIGVDDVATATDTKIANALPVDENVIDTVNYKSGTLSTETLYRTLLGAINADVAQYVHQSDPQDDDPEKPWTGPPLACVITRI